MWGVLGADQTCFRTGTTSERGRCSNGKKNGGGPFSELTCPDLLASNITKYRSINIWAK